MTIIGLIKNRMMGIALSAQETQKCYAYLPCVLLARAWKGLQE